MDRHLQIFLRYLNDRKLQAIVFFYFMISVGLHKLVDLNVQLPCLWTLVTGEHCFACGLTRAFEALIEFRFKAAFKINPLILLVTPLVGYVVISDYIKYHRRQLRLRASNR